MKKLNNKGYRFLTTCTAIVLIIAMTACGQTGAGTADETKAQTETTTAETSKKSYWNPDPEESKDENEVETTTTTTAATTKPSEAKNDDTSSRKSFWDKDDNSKAETTTSSKQEENSDNIVKKGSATTNNIKTEVNAELTDGDVDITQPYTPDVELGEGLPKKIFPHNSMLMPLYEAPSTNASVIDNYIAGTDVVAYVYTRYDNSTFEYVKVGDTYGWCLSVDLPVDVRPRTFDNISLSVLPEYFYSGSETMYCLNDTLEVKASPSDDAETLFEIKTKGSILPLGDSGDAEWQYISTMDNSSFVEFFGWVRVKKGSDNNYYLRDEFIQKYKELYGSEPEWSYNTGAAVGGKPVIYLYPEKKTQVDVKLDLNNAEFWSTYPKYDNGWRVTAYPNGKLTDKEGYTYDYLFWDCHDYNTYDISKGFCVKGEDTVDFLREKLSLLGLNETEMNEFITYWLPQMEHNKYNIVAFQTDAYERNFPISVTPEPDSMLRLFMTYKPVDKYIEVEPQKLKSFERKGFTVVEWGGEQLLDNFKM